VLLVLAAPSVAAQQRLSATEVGLGVSVAMARRTFAGGEVGVGYRPGGQSRVALALAAGSEAGRAAGRAQMSLEFLLTPAARAGAGLYAGLGSVLTVRRGGPGAGFIALLVGLEGAPGRRGSLGGDSWYVELGIGGGVRAAAGWRVRKFPAWWPG
jgi:hypothetical protein